MSPEGTVPPEERERRIRLWTEALVSRAFVQGREALRVDTDRYCCLGVACEVFRVETGRGQWEPYYAAGEDGPGGWRFEVRDEFGRLYREDGAMPEPVAEWLLGDAYTCDPEVDEKFERTTLSALNDTGGTFPEIARLIEGQLLPRYTAAHATDEEERP